MMALENLAQERYFADVIEAMKAQGFVAFAQVAVTTDDFKHHVKAAYARDTRLFFHYPGKQCILTLSYNEHDCGKEGSELQGYWGLRIDLKHDRMSTGVHTTNSKVPLPDPQDEEPSCFDYLDYIEESDEKPAEAEPTPEGFHHAGWSCVGRDGQSTWNLEQDRSDTGHATLTPDHLARVVSDSLKDFLPELASTPFDELQVTSWNPDFSFPGCGPVFWERFRESSMRLTGNRRYLWSIVNRPWGSDGLKR